jgi:hypothetical protein
MHWEIYLPMTVPAQALETEARKHCLQASKLNTRGDSKQGVKPKSQRQKNPNLQSQIRIATLTTRPSR